VDPEAVIRSATSWKAVPAVDNIQLLTAAEPFGIVQLWEGLGQDSSPYWAAAWTSGKALGRYLLELQPERAEGRSWFGEPGRAELVDWGPVLSRAGVRVPPHRVAAAYLELAVLIRALEGLSAAVGFGASPDRGALWAGLFDLRDNLLEF